MHKSVEKPPKSDSVMLFKPAYDNISEVSSNTSTSIRSGPKKISVPMEVHLPPSSPKMPKRESSNIQIYKSGKWKQSLSAKSDEEPMIRTASSEEEETFRSTSSVSAVVKEKVKKKRRARSSSSSTTSVASEKISASSRSDLRSVSSASRASRQSLKPETRLLGVYVHQTGDLKFDMRIRDPRVVVSLVDTRTGQLAVYSQETLKEMQLDQPFILPEFTGSCTFTSMIAIRCKWEHLSYFKENISRLKLEEHVLFFEILQYSEDQQASKSEEPFKIAWAFFRITEADSFPGQRLKLQLFQYQKLSKRKKINQNYPVFNQWTSKQRKKYPGYLDITIKALLPSNLDPRLSSPKDTKEQEKAAELPNFPFYQVPNIFLGKRRSPKKGCLVSKLSPCGTFLAFTEPSETESVISILHLASMEVSNVLQGHQGLIHDLDWHEDSLVSASADNSVILWRLDPNLGVLSRVMPHPTFVYCARFLGETIVTGGRDGVLRVWRCDRLSSVPQLVQEITEHGDFITSILCFNDVVLSADGLGRIIEWKLSKFGTIKKEQEISHASLRKRKILSLTVHKSACKVLFLVQGETDVFSIGMPSGALLRQISVKLEPTKVHQQIELSPDGRFLFCSDADKVLAVDLSSEEVVSEFKVTSFRRGQNFISAISTNFSHLCIAVYGPGGGLVAYKNNSHSGNSPDSSSLGVKFARGNFGEQKGYLATVIEKIDHMLCDSDYHQEVRETLDRKAEKSLSKEESESEENYTFTQESESESQRNRTYSVSGGDKGGLEDSDKDVDENENRTYSVHKEEEKGQREQRNEKEKKNLKNERKVENNRTFSIDKDDLEEDEDDTTISDSFQ